MDQVRKSYYLLVGATVGLYLAVVGLFIVGWISNNNRISDIQKSRVASCERTYKGISEVFAPFIKPPGKRTTQENKDIHTFEATIHRLQAKCDIQVSP